MSLPSLRSSLIPLALMLAGCPEPQWYATCGDPECQGYTGPTEAIPLCTDEAIGGECEADGALCDPEDACNALLECTTEDPTSQVGGCPISLAKYKRDVHYLSGEERAAMTRQALATKLTTWRYHWDSADRPVHLGFLIDDQPLSPAVTPDGGHVDLYGYTSLAIAAAQSQQATLDAQVAALHTQSATLDAQRATIEAQAVELEALRGSMERLSARLDGLEGERGGANNGVRPSP